jgi:hypothetical protein
MWSVVRCPGSGNSPSVEEASGPASDPRPFLGQGQSCHASGEPIADFDCNTHDEFESAALVAIVGLPLVVRLESSPGAWRYIVSCGGQHCYSPAHRARRLQRQLEAFGYTVTLQATEEAASTG